MGTGQVKTPQSSLLFTKIEPILLNECSLDYYRPLVNFLSFEGADLWGGVPIVLNDFMKKFYAMDMFYIFVHVKGTKMILHSV